MADQAGVEQACAALFDRTKAAYAWKNVPSRKLKLWNEVAAESKPALFQFEGRPVQVVWTNDRQKKREIEVFLFIYIAVNKGDDADIGAKKINDLYDAVASSLQPNVAEKLKGGAVTLGGLVARCRIEGEVFRDPGDIDGDGLLIIPVKMLMP